MGHKFLFLFVVVSISSFAETGAHGPKGPNGEVLSPIQKSNKKNFNGQALGAVLNNDLSIPESGRFYQDGKSVSEAKLNKENPYCVVYAVRATANPSTSTHVNYDLAKGTTMVNNVVGRSRRMNASGGPNTDIGTTFAPAGLDYRDPGFDPELSILTFKFADQSSQEYIKAKEKIRERDRLAKLPSYGFELRCFKKNDAYKSDDDVLSNGEVVATIGDDFTLYDTGNLEF
ncbi:MAG: hypothetical protein R3A80_04230 [Bdellovibrionota bacterium]